tara:strand:- start:393 stop:1814 length:1422 start_codon:yes stop_codon:yes gene_type:complete
LLDKKYFFPILFLICVFSRLLTSIYYIEDIDSLRFALSVHEFNLVKLQPHFPGYPIFSFVAKLLYFCTGNMGISFSIIGSVSLFIIIFYSIKICKIEPISYPGIFLILLLFFNPLIWLMSNRYMPDLMGLSISVMTLYYLIFDAERNKYLNYGYFLTGILFGTRLSYIPVLIIPIIYNIITKPNKIKLMYSIFIGMCIWFIPLLYITGFENLLFLASKQTVGHFTDFGGTIFTELNWYKRITIFIQSLWADGLGGYWNDRAWITIVTSLCMLLFLYQFRYIGNWSWLNKYQYNIIALSIITYIIWILLFQNIIYKSRHILPVLLFVIIFIVIAYKYSRRYKPILYDSIATVLLLSLFVVTSTLNSQHKRPTAVSQLYAYVEDLDDSLDIISIPLINYYLKSHGLKKNFFDIDPQNHQGFNQTTNIKKKNIVIGDFRKLFQEHYIIISDTVFYHNPYMNRMWSKIDTYHLVPKK